MKSKHSKTKEIKLFKRYKGKHYKKNKPLTYFLIKFICFFIKNVAYLMFIYVINNTICLYIFKIIFKNINYLKK